MRLTALILALLSLAAFSSGNSLPQTELSELKKSVANNDYKTSKAIFEKIQGNIKSKTDKNYRRFYLLAQKEFYKMPENAKKIIPGVDSLEGSAGIEGRQHNYRARFLRGEYSLALKMIDLKKAIANKDFTRIVEHDLLSVVEESTYKNIKCEKAHNKNKVLMLVNYDHSICSILIDWKNDKKIVKSKMEHLDSLIDKDFPEKKYLMTALQKIK